MAAKIMFQAMMSLVGPPGTRRYAGTASGFGVNRRMLIVSKSTN
jgi:hypothetical protein